MTPLVDFSRRYAFSAAHRLHAGTLTAEQNMETFGKCNHPHGHGHNYVLELTVRGPIHPDTGMAVDMVAMDRMVQHRILDRFHQQNLNLDPLFGGIVSTTENLCRAAWKLLEDGSLGTARVKRLRIEETSNNFFEYAGEED